MSFFPNLFGHHDANTKVSEQKETATQLRSRIDSVFDDFFNQWPGFSGFADSNKFLAPAIDVSENQEMIEVQAELPAVDKDNIHLEVKGNQLLLSGEKTFNKEEKKDHGFHRMERAYGSFRRVIALPFDVDDSTQIQAAYKDGLLTIRIPKPTEEVQKQNKVDIKFHSS